MKNVIAGLLALLCAGCSSLPRTAYHDPIEHFATEGDAASRAVGYALETAGGQFFRSAGSSMHPVRYFAVSVSDFKHTQIGDWVAFRATKDGRVICHRATRWEKNGSLLVSGDTYPARTDWVTEENYLGTVVLICTWGE